MLWYKSLKPFKLYEYYPLCVVGNIFIDMQLDGSRESIIRVVIDKNIFYCRWDGLNFYNKSGGDDLDTPTQTLLTALLIANIPIETFLVVFAEAGGVLYLENMHLLSALYNYRTYRDGVQGKAVNGTCGKVWAYYNIPKKRHNSKRK
jgi:hypothetical protein